MSVIALLFVSFVLGHTTPVSCDADTNVPMGLVVPAGNVIEGWAYVGGEIHLGASVCTGLYAAPGTPAFARSFNVLAHETWHASGEANEGCAELFARVAVFDFLPKFWRVREDTALDIAREVSDYTLRKPAVYQEFGSYACLPRILDLYDRTNA